jgi:hypothetical protein
MWKHGHAKGVFGFKLEPAADAAAGDP